jgi:HEAT repeat protein
MKRLLPLLTCLTVAASIHSTAQQSNDYDSLKLKAWDMLETASASKRTGDRTNAIRALGLLPDNARAQKMAEEALHDQKPEVRTASATALGQMHATSSIPQLEKALADNNAHVVMAAAHSLRQLEDYRAAYEVYYDLLTGARKTGGGMIANQIEILTSPSALARIGFAQAIGFVPFGGVGWDAWQRIRKKDPNPVRAVAATYLTHDPDPATTQALVDATEDKNWIVRAAAVDAIAHRGDRSLLPKVALRFSDSNAKIRFSAAAAVIHLSAVPPSPDTKDEKDLPSPIRSTANEKQKNGLSPSPPFP